jgi:hypothetical protein
MFTSELGLGGFLCRGGGGGHASGGHSSSSHSSSHSSGEGHSSEGGHFSEEEHSYYHSSPSFFFFGHSSSSNSSSSPAVSPTATVTMTGTPADFNPNIIDDTNYTAWGIGLVVVFVLIGLMGWAIKD